MFKQLLTIFIIAAAVIDADDSEGTEFVTTFSGYWIPDGSLINSLIIIPSEENTSCSIKYASQEDDTIVQFDTQVFYGKTNEIRLKNDDVSYHGVNSPSGLHDMPDARIFITCQDKVKLLGKYFFVTRALSDLFLIPAINVASGTNFVTALPPSVYESLSYIIVLPLPGTDSVTVNYKMYKDGNLFNTDSKTYNTALGSAQSYYTSFFEEAGNVTVLVESTSPVAISLVTPWASTTEQYETCQACARDHAAMMLIPNLVKQCNQQHLPQEQRIMTSDFTSKLFISPPVSSDCDEKFKVTVFDDNKLASGKEMEVSKIGSTNITFVDRKEMALVSVSGVMPTIRFGTFFDGSTPINYGKEMEVSKIGSTNITFVDRKEMALVSVSGVMPTIRFGTFFDGSTPINYGHYTHYVPSTAEYVTGKTQFYTLAKNCVLEVYTDNAESFKLDGSSGQFTTITPLSVLSQKYTHILFNIKGLGIHTFESSANYVAYVVCRQVNGIHDSAGYLTGFNRRN
uniref:IgGFc_binding domain-containing protein n=1 Tax=Rhabditophanes sp. KR3021 TaxID=114890 RepID=A0AC35UHD1_9BILA